MNYELIMMWTMEVFQLHKIAVSDTQIGPRSYYEALSSQVQVLHSTIATRCVGEKYADES